MLHPRGSSLPTSYPLFSLYIGLLMYIFIKFDLALNLYLYIYDGWHILVSVLSMILELSISVCWCVAMKALRIRCKRCLSSVARCFAIDLLILNVFFLPSNVLTMYDVSGLTSKYCQHHLWIWKMSLFSAVVSSEIWFRFLACSCALIWYPQTHTHTHIRRCWLLLDGTFQSHTQLNWFHHHHINTRSSTTVATDISIHATVFQIHIKVKFSSERREEKKPSPSNVYAIMRKFSATLFFFLSFSLCCCSRRWQCDRVSHSSLQHGIVDGAHSRFSIYFISSTTKLNMSLLPRDRERLCMNTAWYISI